MARSHVTFTYVVMPIYDHHHNSRVIALFHNCKTMQQVYATLLFVVPFSYILTKDQEIS